MYLWQGGNIAQVKKIGHSRLIDAITVTDSHILTGGRDSKIVVMDKQYNVQFTVDLTTLDNLELKNANSLQVRAITVNKLKNKLMIGTFGHEIVELPINFAQKTVNAQ